MSSGSSGLPQKRTPLRARHVFYLILLGLAFAYFAAPQFWVPWSHFTGGSFHASPWWSGRGSFQGPDGTYQLYIDLSPMDTGSHPSRRTLLDGEGHLCTPSGERLMIHVNGEMDKHLPLNTIGRAIDISTFTRSKPGSFSGMKAPGSPYVNLNGVWGPGKIEASGRLRHEPDVHGRPVGPEATPITVTLQQASYWWAPVCPKP